MKYQDRDKFTLINNEARPGRDRVGTGCGPGFVTLDWRDYPKQGSHITMNKCFLIISFDHQLIWSTIF